MGKLVLVSALLMVALASSAAASGVSLNWGTTCWSDGPQQNLLAFACDTNAGSAVMTLSFAVEQPRWLAGAEILLRGMSSEATVPSWWQMGQDGRVPGTECRSAALTASAESGAGGSGTCVNLWAMRAQGVPLYGTLAYSDGGNAVELLITWFVPPESPVELIAGTEYVVSQVHIAYDKTVGAGACSGCGSSQAWGLRQISLEGPSQFDILASVLPGGNQCLWWQSDGGLGCGPPMPARSTTWGQVKSLYR